MRLSPSSGGWWRWKNRRELENDLARALMNRGNALLNLQRLPEAVKDYDAAIAILRRLVEEENRRELENDLARALMNRGNALSDRPSVVTIRTLLLYASAM